MQSNRDMKGKKIWTVAAGSACLLVGCAQQPQGYAEKILSNPLMNRVDSMKRAHAQTIGLTLYPTYPAGSFKGVGMYPYGYQHGGDWTWFGARMIHALTETK